MPAPSPVLFSQPQAPLCSIFSRTVNASEIILWLLLPFILATKPIPHASCSKDGSYKPVNFFSFIHNYHSLFYKASQAQAIGIKLQCKVCFLLTVFKYCN